MIEFELKFQVPMKHRRAAKSFVSGRSGQKSRQIHLQAAYFDTPQRLLARHAMALRLRREGANWVQTLKGSSGDGLARQEHNAALDGETIDFAAPAVEPARHAGIAIGDRLIEMLDQQGDGLSCCYRTDVRRVVRELSTRYGKVELAFDEGFIEAGARRLPLCELEIELLEGHPLAVLDVARRWALRFGLWLDVRSKAERGDMLANGIDLAAPVKAGRIRIRRGNSADLALQAAVGDCRRQILANASQIASGCFDAEHVHQLRVGLRRLRTALRLFEGGTDAGSMALPLAEPAAMLFRGLAVSRDQAVRAAQISPAIEAAWRAAGRPAGLPEWVSEPMAATPTGLVRAAVCQRLLFDLIEVGLPAFSAAGSSHRPLAAEWPTDSSPEAARLESPGTADLVARRLSKWHRVVLRDAARFDQLDDAGRHLLRKRIKRLVYGAGFAAGLYRRKPLDRLLRSLKPVQDCLGELNDVVTGLRARSGDTFVGWFAAGWLVARRQALLAEALPLLQRLAGVEPIWKNKSKKKTGRR